jgi:hypothetical protein
MQRVRIEESCSHSEGFLRGTCGKQAVAECVYCGRAFCEAHGERGPDYTDACDRKSCTAKLRDVFAHQDWRDRMRGANRVSVCAHEGCEERMHHECSRCRLLFCGTHVTQFTVLNHQVNPPRKELALVCPHCKERRKIWG